MNRAAAAASVPRPALVPSAWAAPVATVGLLGALAGLLVWQYLMPDGFESSFFLNHAGVAHFRDAFGLPRVDVGVGAYRAGFRAWLAGAWVSYFCLMVGGAMGAPLPRRRSLLVMVATIALVVAVLWPPSFSCDVYGYVAYGRMQVLYGMNPYTTAQGVIATAGDATGRFLRWNIPSPYGPLWTTLSVGVVWLLRGAGLLGQVITMKLIGATAVVSAAWAGGRVAERLSPGRGDLAFVGIGLNPLFVIEGAGNAHNDLVMMAFVVATFGAALDGRTSRAVFGAGVAGAIKFLPLLLVPWIVLERWARDPATSWGARVREAAAYALAAALPIAVCYGPYWVGARTLLGLAQRWRSGHSRGLETSVHIWAQGGLLVLVYVAATVWFVRGERARLLPAWAIVTAAVYIVTAGIWLPWYLSWIWIPTLLAWDKRSTAISYLAFCFGVVLTWQYSVPGGG